MRLSAAILLVMPMVCTVCHAQTAPAAPDISVDTLKTVTKELSDDKFEGRAPASETEPAVIDYIVSQFKAAGLKPGNNGKWLQDVPLVQITAQNVKPLTFTGGKQPLSIDYRTDPRSSVIDALSTMVINGTQLKLYAWYDNEWGYANRTVELARKVGQA